MERKQMTHEAFIKMNRQKPLAKRDNANYNNNPKCLE